MHSGHCWIFLDCVISNQWNKKNEIRFKKYIFLLDMFLIVGGRVPVTGMLAGMNLTKPGINLSKPGMNLSKPGKKHRNHVIILYNVVFYWLTHIQNDHWVIGIHSNKWLLTAVWLKYFPWKHRHMKQTMMTSSNGTVFSVTGPLWGEFAGHRWIPLTKACDAEIWCFYDLHLNKRLSKPTRRR